MPSSKWSPKMNIRKRSNAHCETKSMVARVERKSWCERVSVSICTNFYAHCFRILSDSRTQLQRHKEKFHSNDPAVQQKRIKKAADEMKQLKSFNDEQKLMHCLIADNLPLAIVESIWFRAICELDVVRSRTTYARSVLPRIYLAMRREIESVLHEQISLSLQSDSWTDAFSNTYFQGLTGWCVLTRKVFKNAFLTAISFVCSAFRRQRLSHAQRAHLLDG